MPLPDPEWEHRLPLHKVNSSSIYWSGRQQEEVKTPWNYGGYLLDPAFKMGIQESLTSWIFKGDVVSSLYVYGYWS